MARRVRIATLQRVETLAAADVVGAAVPTIASLIGPFREQVRRAIASSPAAA